MKYLILALTVFFSFTSNLFSQDEEKSSLLWEISGKKVKSPSYLFGTMHLIPKDDFYFPEELKEKVTSTDLLLMEVAGLQAQSQGTQLIMLEEGNLFDFFTEEQSDSIFVALNDLFGYTEEQVKTMFGSFKPFFLTQLFSSKQFGEAPESYEITLENLAKSNNMSVAGLETVEEQMGFINDLSQDMQVEMVMAAVRSAGDEMDEDTKKLIAAYTSRDLDQIHQYFIESSATSSEIESKLLNNRNKKWIDPIKKTIRKNKTFIAVGAAHLPGENGVINLLRKEGYTVTPIQY